MTNKSFCQRLHKKGIVISAKDTWNSSYVLCVGVEMLSVTEHCEAVVPCSNRICRFDSQRRYYTIDRYRRSKETILLTAMYSYLVENYGT